MERGERYGGNKTETFSATKQILSPPLLPSSSLGKSPTGERGDILFSPPPPSIHLCPPQPFVQHNINLPISCNHTFFSSSPFCSSLSTHPSFISIILTSLTPFLSPHCPYFPSSLILALSPSTGRTPAGRVLISLIGGVRMQFHLSSPLHSSAGHSITFRCSDADEAVLVAGDEEGGRREGRR